MKKNYFFIVILFFFGLVTFGQTYNMANGANGTISTCSGTFRDGAGNYSANQNSTITFCPSTPGDLIRITFTAFDTESGFDYLDVWQGNAVGAPGTANDRFMGNPPVPFVITSTSPDGCLSFQFISDGSFQYTGWSATISCVTPCVPPTAALVDTSTVDICPSTSLTPGSTTVAFNASNSTTPSGSLVRYEWDWGDGTNSVTATPNTTHTFPTTGGLYLVRLRVRNNIFTTDPLGCLSSNSVTRVIRVMPEPNFTGTSPTTLTINCGDNATLNGSALSQTIVQNTPSVISGPVNLPDGSGSSYNSQLDFSGLFPPGATMSAGCYPTVTFDIEHSYTEDLDIILIAPSGEQVILFDQHAPTTPGHFGACSNGATDGVAGCTATYSVVNTGGASWTAAASTTAGPPTANGACAYTGVCETGGSYYIPQTYTSTNSFAALNGATLNGVWTLRVVDNIASDDGVLSNWSLTFPTGCYANLLSETPDLNTATWSHSGSGPALPSQTTTNTVVNNPGPSCPAPGPCVGNQLTNNVTVGPFNTAGSYVYSFTVTDQFGCQYRRNVTVNVNPGCPTASISYTGSPYCTTSAPVNVNLTGTGSYTSGVFSAPAGLSINTTTGQITPSTSTPGTYTVTYTIAPNACCAVPTVATTSVTISSGPTVSSLNSTSPVCSGANAVFNITGTPNSIVSYNINGGATLTVTLNGTGNATVTVPSITANTTLNATQVSLAGAPVTGNGLSATGGVNPGNSTGVISASGAAANATNCAYVDNTNSTLTITLQNTVPAGTTITISIARDTNAGAVTITDGTANVGTFNAGPNDVLQYLNVTTTVATNTIVITRTGGIVWIDGLQYTTTPLGCTTPLSLTNTVTVTPQNTIAAGTNQTVCINSAITNITLATTGATGATFTGLPAGVTGSWAGNVATISGTPTAAGTFNYTVTTTGGCPPATTTGTITVNPQNTIAVGTNQTVCINTAITTINLATTTATGATFTGLPAGVTGTWAGDVATISGTPTASGTFNYTVTTTGGCPPATTTGTITVTPQNTIAAGTSETVCINTAITTINLATTTATGATFTGLPAGVTGTWAGDVATISGTPTVSGTFNYTVTTTGGCPPATATGTITVNPTATPVTGFSYSTPVCINSTNPTPTPVAGFTTGGVYSSTLGLTINSSTGEIDLASSTAGTYTVTYFYGATACGAAGSSTFNITILPQNVIASGTNQTVCINSAITNIALATTGATGATFAGLPAGVTGSWSGNVATISGTPTVSGTFNYTVTTTGGCPPATATGAITVTPLNTIAAGTNQTVCINSAITNITLATTGATGVTFAGLPAGVTGSWSGNVATISGTPTVSGTFNYTVTTTGGCPPATATGAITVTPLNTIASGTNQTVCINSAIINIALATTGATGATFTGLPAGVTGAWSGNVATISGTPTVSGTFNYTVTTTGGCPPATTSGTITVNLQNTIASGTSQMLCVNTPLTSIALATTGATGATFAGLPAGVTGSWAGNVATISGTPTASGTFNYTVTTTGGCPPATATGTITVNPTATPVTGFSYSTPVCINSTNPTPTPVAGFTTGGVYSSTLGLTINSSTGEIDLASSTAGTYTVTYFYGATACGAAGSSTFNITILPQNVIASGTNQTVCINSAITNIALATTGATGATFAGLPAGVTGSWSGNVATISGTPTVSGTFNYTVTTTGGCPPATATGAITVTPLNTIAAGTNQTVCINSAITNITLATTGATGVTFAGLPAGVTGSWSGNVATISGTPTVSGT
uniref:proprotein convertase P-domain-containing protein n=1 Tax=Flavobacterium sp. TaxID=239 RepID=UPI0040486D1E